MAVIRIASAVVLLAFTALAFWSWTPRRSRSEVERLARQRGLVLDPETCRHAERFYFVENRGRAIGAAAVALPVVLLLPPRGSVSIVVFLFAMVAGGQLGAVVALHRANRTTADEVRVARLTAPRVGDFVPPELRWWAMGMTAVVVLATGVWLRFGDRDHLSVGQAIGLAPLALASLAGAEFWCRVIVRTAQPSGSPTMLALRDELRAEQLVHVVSLAGSVSIVALIPFVIDWLPGPLLFPIFIGLGVVPLATVERHRRTWVRDHLWPAPAR